MENLEIEQNRLPKGTLSIAGAESGGTAGIHADLKAFQEVGVYGMATITAIVGRHPKTNKNVHPIDLEAIEAQFATAVARNPIDSIKTGMLFSQQVIKLVANMLNTFDVPRPVVDPVMIGKLDSKLLNDDAIATLQSEIFPLAKLITPNMMEASVLLGNRKIEKVTDLAQAAIDLHEQGPQHIIVKGGRLEGPAIDVLYDGKTLTYYEAPRIQTQNTSGAGDSYSAAIAAYLAQDYEMEAAVLAAKQLVTTAIAHSFSYSSMPGPVNIIGAKNYDSALKVRMYK
ncbi:MAG TPA: bifunctional hydroxymethylpyrimidine kinase/phosphomethylpyrimidine kinase [Flavobacteriaceae bacterium]|nr:bifunctional hydroxymethylpyrimidine kinase/phosphomethylpyrimidine kinase [Flavobacteriaceae bacterium]